MAEGEDDDENNALRTPLAAAGGAAAREPPPVPPREFVAAQTDLAQLGALADLEKLSVLSYNVLSQMGARRLQRSDRGYVGAALLTTLQRRERLRSEILSYDADVLCLQEVDDYDDYWSVELTANGYDSVFAMHPAKREQGDANSVEVDHGLVVAFKRELFQLFRTQQVDLNELLPAIADPNLAAKCKQDCVALCVQVQPWETCRLPSAVCVVTTQLAAGDGPAMDRVRVLQAEFLCREIARFNAVANLPIVLAGTFNALPSSDVYHVISTGRRRPRPQPPAQMDRPDAVDATPTSVRLAWRVPAAHGDAPIDGYKIAVKNCTSAALGFSMHELELDGGGDVDASLITMLSGGITYQFRVAARNRFGFGPFSPPSLPVTTPKWAKLAVEDDESKDGSSSSTAAAAAARDASDDAFGRGAGLPLYIDGDVPPQVKPYEPSFGSGRTPRFESGAANLQVSPRKLLLRADAKQNEFATLQPRADRDDALVHGEQFESAYAAYQGGLSEPELTFASERCVGTIDYIFFSAAQFAPFQLLEMPALDDLEALGVDVRQPHLAVDAEWAKHRPRDWKATLGVAKNDNQAYTGEWVTPQLPNAFARSSPWLPNRTYPSDHLALACVLAVKKENLAVEWN